jgi:hypothetical protein
MSKKNYECPKIPTCFDAQLYEFAIRNIASFEVLSLRRLGGACVRRRELDKSDPKGQRSLDNSSRDPTVYKSYNSM